MGQIYQTWFKNGNTINISRNSSKNEESSISSSHELYFKDFDWGKNIKPYKYAW